MDAVTAEDPTADDATLVERALDGEREAYAALVERHARRIAAVCWGTLGRRDVVPDMVQETFTRGWRNLDRLRKPGSVGSWLHGIAKRACIDWLRSPRRDRVPLAAGRDGTGGLDDLANPGEGPEERVERSERRTRVLEAIDELPELYRRTLCLFHLDDRSYAEIAEMEGISTSTVNGRLTKARTMLRNRLRDDEPEGGGRHGV